MDTHPLHFYLIATSVKKYIKGESIKDFFPTYIGNVKRTKPDLKKVSENIYQKVINKHFSKEEFAKYLIHNSIFEENFLETPYKWEINEICNISKIYNKKSLTTDQEFILNIAQKTNVRDIQKYFDINSDGESFWFKFLKQKHITPMFVISFINKINVNYDEESKEHERVRRLINALIKIESK